MSTIKITSSDKRQMRWVNNRSFFSSNYFTVCVILQAQRRILNILRCSSWWKMFYVVSLLIWRSKVFRRSILFSLCIKFLFPKFSQVWKNIKLWRGGGEYNGFWEECNVEKKGNGKQHHVLFKIQVIWKSGKRWKFWGRKSRYKEMGVWKNTNW